MNLESINIWLDEEYGCSYTRLEELHNFYFEKYTAQKEEIIRLNNIIDKAINILKKRINKIENQEWKSYTGQTDEEYLQEQKELIDILKGE